MLLPIDTEVEVTSGLYEGRKGKVRRVYLSGYLVEVSANSRLFFEGWRLKKVSDGVGC